MSDFPREEPRMASLPLSPQDLLQAAQMLPPEELDTLVDEMITLRARSHAPSLSRRETNLLQQINADLPDATWQRYRHLSTLRRAEQLSESEYAELLRLSDVIDKRHAQRMEALAHLAALRGQSLDEVMRTLGIAPRHHA